MTLLVFAKRALENVLLQVKTTFPPLVSLPSELSQPAALFVTLRTGPALRGCLGNLESNQPLAHEVMETTIRSATEDPRFESLTIDDLTSLTIEISVLSPFQRVNSPDDIIPGQHGVMVRRGFQKGLYLPQVWNETAWDKNRF